MTVFWPVIICKTFLLNKYIKLLLDICVFGKPKSLLEIHFKGSYNFFGKYKKGFFRYFLWNMLEFLSWECMKKFL